MKKVRKLREENKVLEGRIDEQKKTKKFLKDLFLQQTTNKMEKPTKEQLDLLNEADDSSTQEDSESEQSESESEPGSPSYSTASSKR